MSLILSHGSVGEAGIRLLKRLRKGDRQELHDLLISVALRGEDEHGLAIREQIAVEGGRIAERVYALARDHAGEQPEPFGIVLANHFVERLAGVGAAVIEIEEHGWSRVTVSGRPRDRAFAGAAAERRTTVVRRVGTTLEVNAGFRDLPILRVSSELSPVDAGTLTASWRYGWTDVPFGLHWQQVREVVLESFADSGECTVQHTIEAMAHAALEQCPAIAELQLDVRAGSYRPADLSRFGMSGTDDLLIPYDEPQTLTTVTVRRDESR